jgi:hypothetical protein
MSSLFGILLSMTLPGGQKVEPPAGVPKGGLDFLGGVLRNGLTYFLIFAIVLCLISITWSGVQWASASGDKEKISRARGRITWSIVGLVIVSLTFFILSLVGYFFNVDLLGA